MKKAYFLITLLLGASASVLAQQVQILPQKKQDSVLQKLQQLGLASINKSFEAVPFDPDLLNLEENIALEPDFKQPSMPVYKPGTLYQYSMPVYKPSKEYEYKMRIIVQPVENSTNKRS